MVKYDVWVFVSMENHAKLVIESDSILEVSKEIKHNYRGHNGYMIIPKISKRVNNDPIEAFFKYWKTKERVEK